MCFSPDHVCVLSCQVCELVCAEKNAFTLIVGVVMMDCLLEILLPRNEVCTATWDLWLSVIFVYANKTVMTNWPLPQKSKWKSLNIFSTIYLNNSFTRLIVSPNFFFCFIWNVHFNYVDLHKLDMYNHLKIECPCFECPNQNHLLDTTLFNL